MVSSSLSSPQPRSELLDTVADWIAGARAGVRRVLTPGRPGRVAVGVAVALSGVAVLAVAAWALGVGLGHVFAPSVDTVAQAGIHVWVGAIDPLIVDPIAGWFATHTSGLPLGSALLVVLWVAAGAGLWLLALRRSMQARVLWPVWAAATAWCAHSGAGPELAAASAGAVGLVWLVVSLPVYTGTLPEPGPEPEAEDTGQEQWQQLERHRMLYRAAVDCEAPAEVRGRIAGELSETVAELAPPAAATRTARLVAARHQRERELHAGSVLAGLAGFLGGWGLFGAVGGAVFVVVSALGLLLATWTAVAVDVDEIYQRQIRRLYAVSEPAVG